MLTDLTPEASTDLGRRALASGVDLWRPGVDLRADDDSNCVGRIVRRGLVEVSRLMRVSVGEPITVIQGTRDAVTIFAQPQRQTEPGALWSNIDVARLAEDGLLPNMADAGTLGVIEHEILPDHLRDAHLHAWVTSTVGLDGVTRHRLRWSVLYRAELPDGCRDDDWRRVSPGGCVSRAHALVDALEFVGRRERGGE